jgi:hypothetical protein
MPYPKLKLSINQKADINNAIRFILKKTASRQFMERFLPQELIFILNKNFTNKERHKILVSFTKHFYQLEEKNIADGFHTAVKKWRAVENKYYKLVDQVFKNHPWPKGNYRGYVSIYLMFPRYIDEKIFFLPYQNTERTNSNNVIAHEMLHFIFFDYIDKKLGIKQHTTINGNPENFVWQVSEVFNNVIEGSKPFNKLFHRKPKPYPGTEKIYAKMKNQWAKKQDVDWLLEQWFGKRKK